MSVVYLVLWASTYTNVKAKFESQGIEEDRDGRNTTIETFNVYVEDGVSIVPGDRLVKGGNQYHEIVNVQQVKKTDTVRSATNYLKHLLETNA